MTVWENLRAFKSLWVLALAFLGACGLYLLTLWGIVARECIMPVARERTVRIHEFLQAKAAEQGEARDIYVLGSSVVVEGVDCHVIDPLLKDGWESYNLAWTAAGPKQWLLILPALERARPSIVVLCIVATVGTSPLAADLAAIAGWEGLVSRRYLATMRPYFGEEDYAKLAPCRIWHLMTYRSFPFEALDAYMWESSRPDLRYEGYATNFKAPWVRRNIAPAKKVAQEIEDIAQRAAIHLVEHPQDALVIVEEVVRHLRSNCDCQVLLVLAPVNPKLRGLLSPEQVESAKQAYRSLAQQQGICFVDHTDILQATDFSDAVHPFSSGRAIWSRALGKALSDCTMARSLRKP
ncbi:MAG TPA: hypothetical protein VMW24_22385 [Sedimentisphaerales bacterium]|nr:hypothetical protein [Sedimentisphaerales bacterium]